MPDTCDLCGTETGSGSVAFDGDEVDEGDGREGDGREADGREADDGDSTFCSPGCRDVARTLDGDEPDPAGNADRADATAGAAAEADVGPPADDHAGDSATDRSFLRVDGMHAATCEAYLESVAESQPGVVAAEASYVTETIRVDHDPEATSARDLRDALSTTGYTAHLRTETAEVDDAATGGTRRSREVEGVRKRRSDEILGLRYAAGIVFGAFLLIPYVAVLYPAHLATVVDHPALATYKGAFELSGASGFLFLRIYFVLTGIVLVFTGKPVLRGAYTSLKMRRPNTDLLVAITAMSAFWYGTGAVLVGQNDIYYDLTIVVAAVVTGAAFYETAIKQRALARLTELTVSQVDDARRYEPDGTTEEVPVEALDPGDRVLVREGERVPVDGTLDEDVCTVEEAVVTGEALPVVKREGDAVIGGSVVTDGAAVVTVGDPVTSSIDRITEALWTIQSADHGVQRRADRVTGYVAPLLALLAVGVAGTVLTTGGAPGQAVLGALLALFVACPWTLGLATPLSVASSIRSAMDRGIVVFDETIFERLRDVDVVVFDKTGTLTTGEMHVVAADAPEDLLVAAATLERRAAHPAAAAIVDAFAPATAGASAVDGETRPDGGDGEKRPDGGDGGDTTDATDADSAESEPTIREFATYTNGVGGVVADEDLLVGSLALFDEQGWTVADDVAERAQEARGFGRLPVVVGRDGKAEGVVVVGDEPRDGWETTLTSLAERGVDVAVLTGDDPEATAFFDRQDAVDHVFAGVPPAGKTATVRRFQRSGRVAMVGDGTNDAPALAQADLGVSLGSGTALAADAADVAIVDDDLGAVETAFDLAAAARRHVVRNLALGLTYNAIAIPAALLGLFNPLTAALAVAISGGLVGLNSSRDLLDG
ncbi:heavy metal translocating P-type ATPase [Haloparvum sp. PAK95]|uniref:heavy metal translocating P-type ATPase n=1 Tax=Haloparvum sp. PAK95 TaxID=3418962 RepID=UPI003D2EE0E6